MYTMNCLYIFGKYRLQQTKCLNCMYAKTKKKSYFYIYKVIKFAYGRLLRLYNVIFVLYIPDENTKSRQYIIYGGSVDYEFVPCALCGARSKSVWYIYTYSVRLTKE